MFSPALMRCSSLSSHLFKPKTYSSFSSSVDKYRPWSGLQNWRESPLNENRFWGPSGPEPVPESPLHPNDHSDDPISSASSLAELGAVVLSTSDPLAKSKLSHLAFSRWRNENLPIGVFDPPSRPARPPKPILVRLF